MDDLGSHWLQDTMMSDIHQLLPSGSDHRANFPASGLWWTKATIGQFRQQVIMGYQMEGFSEVKLYDINLFSLVQVIGHLVVKEMRLVKQDLPATNQCWLSLRMLVSASPLRTASLMSFYKIFPRVEVRLMGL